MRTFYLLVCLFFGTALPGPAQDAEPKFPAPPELIAKIDAGIRLLNQTYWSPALNIWLDRPGDDLRAHYEGRRNPPWWPSANAVEALIDFMDATGSDQYQASLGQLYFLQKDRPARIKRVVEELKRRRQWSESDEKRYQARLQRPAAPAGTTPAYYSDFQNEYLDDSGWWALAWLRLYDRTKAPACLQTARVIHAHMAKNWRPDKGGGVLWCEDEDKQRPNTITNNLFLLLSARLYERTHEAAFLASARQTLAWIHETKLYDGIALVDGPGHEGDYWTYNQGTFIGGLTALYLATGSLEYLEEASKVTCTVLDQSGLALPDGCLFEKNGTNGDAALFKGITARYLAQLRAVLMERALYPETVQKISRCLEASVVSILHNAMGKDGLYTAGWQKGDGEQTGNFATQTSAITALIAALPKKKK